MMKQPDQVGTIVGSSVHLTGAIKDASDINIFGTVDGEVLSEEKVVIEESARVKGPVTAREVIISGFVNGTITAKDRIELNTSGTIKGNIDTKELLIHSGATFIGKCIMPEKETGEPLEDAETFEAEVEEGKSEDEEVEQENDNEGEDDDKE